ncbi:hypothetical protein OL239_01890 [Arthrobacter sp. ATA002]|uniref:hypothetical protein n=1 Tax=Arthrobacter sp. ATA002 TaxID=2991715 RepID=UPI0022A73070|nr:hypothetical protein [Arthrobacter sp. ATA002]WAP52098.1 hypothetical protein OL239_01890 [Arthrobacter sp. ATA002]
MSPEQEPDSPGYAPRLLAAAAFVTQRATEESLTELRLTQERSTVLGVLASGSADEAALAEMSGLAPGCVHECVQALQCCGYAARGPKGRWAITAAGTRIRGQVEQAEARLLAGATDDGLRRELSALIRALTPGEAGAA